METSRQPATASSSPNEESASAKRQRWTIKQKRQIVEQTLLPGASVARVARSHGVNANQVFYWRKQHLAGRLGNSSPAIKLLPVTVDPSPSAAAVAERALPGAIHIKLNQAQIRIEGNADPILVRMVLDALRG
ncbi:MAG TPA: transposase [Terriglobales bacterium]|nr:transposase [Terriglobales bacterium]